MTGGFVVGVCDGSILPYTEKQPFEEGMGTGRELPPSVVLY